MVENMLGALRDAVVMTLVVLLLFLANTRAALITAVSLPMSYLLTFAGLKMLGYEFDMVTLTAVVIAVGLLADDAVVVIENIERRMRENGETGLAAAAKGTGEILLADTSGTISTLIVLVPIMFVGGYVQNVLRPLTVTLSVALFASLIVSVTIIPILASRILKPGAAIFNSVAVTFFAFEGFRVITNAAEDMDNPSRTLPRAMFTAIVLVLGLYVAVSFAVFGSLPVDRVIATKDYALAEAAKPAFGAIGFTIVAITALVSTASSINANLYAVTNVTYQMAKDGELPKPFGKPIGHSREGLVISGILNIVLALLLDLTEIAVLGSISILMVHGLVHLGHLRKHKETGANPGILIAALLASLVSIALAVSFVIRHTPKIIYLLVVFLVVSGGLEWLLQRISGREITARTPQSEPSNTDA